MRGKHKTQEFLSAREQRRGDGGRVLVHRRREGSHQRGAGPEHFRVGQRAPARGRWRWRGAADKEHAEIQVLHARRAAAGGLHRPGNHQRDFRRVGVLHGVLQRLCQGGLGSSQLRRPGAGGRRRAHERHGHLRRSALGGLLHLRQEAHLHRHVQLARHRQPAHQTASQNTRNAQARARSAGQTQVQPQQGAHCAGDSAAAPC
mmetsp:Transcript_8946/g.12387  ORF Transcript_8946/g.12387 Transcript_8946/m.12387 type:complete len:203 (+) Transcript_8946:209-817(+)